MCGHRLELSTGVVVGFCYHKAADLCVRQAAHSLPCLSYIRSCSAIAVSVNVIKPFAREGRAPNCPLRVWSLTGYELRLERPGARVVLVQSVRFFWILWIRFALVAKDSLDWIWRTDFTVCAQRTSLPVHPVQRISSVGGAQQHSKSCSSGLLQHALL